MTHKIRNKCLIPNLTVTDLVLDDATINGATLTTASITNATIEGEAVDLGISLTASTDCALTSTVIGGARRALITLTDRVVSIDSDDDYGSAAIASITGGNIAILGAVVDLVGTPDGAVVTDVTAVDAALGTVAITSTDFSNSGEQNLVAEVDVASAGVLQAVGGGATFLAASGSIFLNNQIALGASTGTVTWNGTVLVTYVDLGVVS